MTKRIEETVTGTVNLAAAARQALIIAAAKPPVFTHGAAMRVYDATGRDYLDASGFSPFSLRGHGDAGLTAARGDCPGGDGDARPLGDAGRTRIIASSNWGAARDALCSFARADQRRAFITTGESMLDAVMSANAARGGARLEYPFYGLSEPDYHGLRHIGESESAFESRLVVELESFIDAHSPPQTVSFVFVTSPVNLKTGLLRATGSYYRSVSNLLQRRGIPLVVEETATFGRVAGGCASEAFALRPAAMVLVSGSAETQTAPQLIASMIAANFTQRVDLLSRCFQTALMKIKAHSLMGDVSQIGLLATLDFLRRGTDDQIQNCDARCIARTVAQCALRHGLIAPAVGRRVLLALPLSATHEDIDELVLRLLSALDEADKQQQ